MSDEKKFIPFVAPNTNMAEFTARAVFIGLILSVILGAANAYLGLKAGMTIAATYPAAVIGMAILRTMKGTVLEENITRTVGAIGESVAAGAIFTLPAFFISGLWDTADPFQHYFTASIILIAGGILGILFVVLLRKVMVEDAELPFPESIAAAEIHKSGQSSSNSSKFLFGAMLLGILIKALAEFKLFAESLIFFIPFPASITKIIYNAKVKLSSYSTAHGGILAGTPGITPAYMGVGYIIGPKLGAINFSGGIIAFGLMIPIILFFYGPAIVAESAQQGIAAANIDWQTIAYEGIWKGIVKPIAIGGMLVGACFTLFRMRKSLGTGLKRSIDDAKKVGKAGAVQVDRTERDLKFSWVITGILGIAVVTFLISYFLFNTSILIAIVSSTVLLILAFFFAAVSGYLVGIIGSSNNPISGLTLTTLVITAVILVALGAKGKEGVAAVLGVAAIVCVAAAVAGEMLQDLKAGHILGGTPSKMQIGNIIGVVISGLVMFGVLVLLNQSDIAQGLKEHYTGGFGSKNLSAPQAGLMATLSQGIVTGNSPWALIIMGMLMCLGLITMQIKSPMLVFIGMYLPLETTFAIFLGGVFKGIVDNYVVKRGLNEAQKIRVENIGILLASGLIAGEALTGLAFAPFKILNVNILTFFTDPEKSPIAIIISGVILVIIALALIRVPLKNAGAPDAPAPPSAAV
jgi:putative OPT family oligopeptide transporter